MEASPWSWLGCHTAAQTARTDWESLSYGCSLKRYLLFSVEMGFYSCLWGSVMLEKSKCVYVCDGFSGPVGSERRKLMEFSTSKRSLPSNQFNTARLKPTHIHQFWLDRHCDPDACSDGPARVSCFSARRRGQRSPSHLSSWVVHVHSSRMGFSWSRQRLFNMFELALSVCLGGVEYLSHELVTRSV